MPAYVSFGFTAISPTVAITPWYPQRPESEVIMITAAIKEVIIMTG
jgi:hypothetical protein